MVEAAILYNVFATGVLPVKVTFFTILFSHISLPTSTTFLWVVTMFMTPSGMPARFASCHNKVNTGTVLIKRIEYRPQREQEQKKEFPEEVL
jgi:hypothetical protein